MTDNELEERASAERLADYDLAHWQGPSQRDGDIRDAVKLARAWKRDHPTDDDELTSGQWLKSIGFYAITNNLFDIPIQESRGWNCFLRIDIDALEAIVMQAPAGCDSTGLVLPETPVAVRGDVRKLCKVLGAKTKEPQ